MRKTLHILIVLLLLNAATAGGLWFGWNAIHEKKQEETRLRAELSEEDLKGQRLSSLQRTLAAARAEHARILPFLFGKDEESQIKFFSAIEGLGRSTSGAAVEVGTFELIKQDPAVIRVSLAITGSWSEVYHALRLIEEFPAHLAITRLEIKSPEGAPTEKWSAAVALDLLSVSDSVTRY